MHHGGVYYNMEGPQFSSRGESLTYRKLGYDLIGMTQAIEAKLARELEMCFLPLAFVTDYDCWHEDTAAVTVEMVVQNLQENTENARELDPPPVRAHSRWAWVPLRQGPGQRHHHRRKNHSRKSLRPLAVDHRQIHHGPDVRQP